MKIFLGHPTGNQFFRHLAESLAADGVLGGSASCLNLAALPEGFLAVLPRSVRDELSRRTFSEVWARGMHTRPGREAGRLLANRLGWKSLVAHETGPFSTDAVYGDFDRWMAGLLARIGRESSSLVYCYEDGARETFRAARTLGLGCAYELPITYWETTRRLMAEEAERLPAWRVTMGGELRDSAAKLTRKVEELELADAVICPSHFVARSLPAWATGKTVIVAPYGTPDVAWPAEQAERPERVGPLRVLFAGSMGQRKGIGDLFAAIRMLSRSDVELVVMGTPLAPMAFYREQASFTYEPGRSHAGVLALMRSCDVLCLPSIVEGRALVMQEAMSQGLPIIITPNTGGEDLVAEGETGFLVPIRSPATIAEKIAWFADHRDTIAEMGQRAREKAAGFSWRNFGRKVVAGLGALDGSNTVGFRK